MSKPPKVSIIILTTNALNMTKEQLKYISELNATGFSSECIVVDNASHDKTKQELSDFKLPNMEYKFIESGSNMGFSGGNNLGIKYAVSHNCDYLILMNNDLIIPKDFVTKLVNFMEDNPDVGIASPKMYFAKGYEFHKDRYKDSDLGHVIWYAGGIIDRKNAYASHKGVDEVDKGQYDKTTSTDFANGAALIIKREVINKVGYLDPALFLYWEDADFSERVKKSGFKVMYYPGTQLWHKVSSSTGGSGSSANDYFLTRNRFYFAIKYLPMRTKLAVIRDTFKLILTGRKWQRRGAFDAICGIRGIGAWAVESNEK